MPSPIEQYLQQIEAALKQGDATEHTHRPFLKTLVESLRENITATNEPKRKGGNAPDFVVLLDRVPIGYIEAKDVGKPLGTISESAQLKRYRESLNNLILTNYLEFVWFEHGEFRNSMRLATAMPDGTVIRCFDVAEDQLIEIFRQFFESEVPSVTTAQDLAERMASRAKRLEESVESVLRNDASQSLRGLMEEFKKDLLPDLDDKKFADLYTQTLAYGLFTACYYTRASRHSPSGVFNREAAFANLPRSNPFLKRMFQQIAGFEIEDEPFVWAVDNIAALLNRADMSEVMKDFGRGKDDPVIHFYETFLKAYDPKMRELRGVYYTPTPVVGYIALSVDAILKRDFGLKDGIADSKKIEGTDSHKVLILDPATGTGTFLAKVIDLIYERHKREPQIWKGYVRDHLLPRLFGFEFLVAPYSIAHLKLGLRLADTGFEFEKDERLNIFLTNTLEEVQRLGETDTAGMGFWIHEEATKAQHVKKDAPVMVILGNPPYSGHSANEGTWMRNLLRGIEDTKDGRLRTENYFEVDGKPLGEKNPKWLNNDYVKFIRFSQWRIEQTGYGILAFITSNSYLDSPTFRGMRQSLMRTFDDIYILDLHGNSKKKEKAEDGSPDQNVFDITEGVNIGIFVKKSSESCLAQARASSPAEEPAKAGTQNAAARVFHHSLLGVREVFRRSDIDGQKQLTGGKYKYLRENDVTTTEWTELDPQSPFYLFLPQNMDLLEEYEKGWKVTDIFPVNVLGFQTHRDHFAIDLDEGTLRSRIEEFRNTETSDDEIRRKYEVKNLQIDQARKQLRSDADWQSKFIDCLYRPFDKRPCYFDSSVMDRPRRELLDHVFGKENLCLNIVRQTKAETWQHAVVSNSPTPAVYVEMKDGSNVFPLYLYPTERTGLFDDTGGERRANLAPEFIADFSGKLGLAFSGSEPPALAGGTNMAAITPPAYAGSSDKTFSAEDVFAYAYAVFHSPTYRSRYAEFLKIDFSRLPLTSDVELFQRLVSLGDELVKTHLLERDLPEICVYPADGDNIVEAIRFEPAKNPVATAPGSDKTGRVWISSKQYFDDVPSEVWEFHIGGYQVCHKWLKDRKGRTLDYDDLTHYKKIVSALSETIRIMSEIDAVIEKHGGFPFK